MLLGGNPECLNPDCPGPTAVAVLRKPAKAPAAPAVMQRPAGIVQRPGTQGARGSSVPQEWSTKYAYKPSGGEAAAAPGHLFRKLEQETWGDIHNMTEAQCKKRLLELGLLPPLPPRVSRKCHECQGDVRLETRKGGNGKVLRCKDWKCDKKVEAETAYSPLYLDRATSMKDYLKACYCYSMQLRIDQTTWFADMSENKAPARPQNSKKSQISSYSENSKKSKISSYSQNSKNSETHAGAEVLCVPQGHRGLVFHPLEQGRAVLLRRG